MDRTALPKRDKLGEILIRQGSINRQQLDLALEKQSATGDYLGEILIHLGYAESADVYRVLARAACTTPSCPGSRSSPT